MQAQKESERFQIENSSGGLDIVIPPYLGVGWMRWRRILYLSCVFLAGTLFAYAFMGFSFDIFSLLEKGKAPSFLLIGELLLSLFLLKYCYIVVIAMLGTEKIHVFDSQIRIQIKFSVFGPAKTFKLEEISDLEFTGSPPLSKKPIYRGDLALMLMFGSLSLRWRGKLLRFGRHLSSQDAKNVAKVLEPYFSGKNASNIPE